MPLVDLTTNLKSLKYGRDTTNGGSSGEPFITKDINGLTIEDLGRTGGSDLLIRGGFLLGDRITDDVKRIGKYLSTPEGLLWSTTQNVLSASGVRIYGGYPKLAQAANIFRLNDGTYLPTSTLLQLAANPFGGHLNKQGTDPTGLSVLGRPEYVKLQRDLNTANLVLGGDFELNRLLKLRKEHITGFSNGPLYSYLGGPGAGKLVGGLGKTDIRFADQRTPTYQRLNDSYFQTTSKNAFSKFVKTTLSSNLIEVTTYGVSSAYGLNPEINNLISRGNGLTGTGNGTFGQSVINPNYFQNTPLNEGNLVDRFAARNLLDLKLGNIEDKYVRGYKKEYKVNSSPEFGPKQFPSDSPIPTPDRRFNDPDYRDSYLDQAKTQGVSSKTTSTLAPDNFTAPTDINNGVDGNNTISEQGQKNPNSYPTQKTYPTPPTENLEGVTEDFNKSFNPVFGDIQNTTPSPFEQNKNAVESGDDATLDQTELYQAADATRSSTTIIDFRRRVKKKNTPAARKNGALTDSLNWDDNIDKQIATRVGLGDPGNPNIDRSDYTKGGGDARTGVDKINSLYLYKSENVTSKPIKNDFAKFRIATIDPDNPKKKTFAHFRAYIDGMSDEYGASWNSYKYMGRGEEFFNYEGFTRNMNLNWTVFAQSKEELSIQYQKLNYLASTLAPNYSKAGFMRGNIHQLTIGAYVYEQPGIITSLNYTIPDESPWEIAIPTVPSQTSNTSGTVSSDSSVKELPHMIKVQMSFKPIHKFLPQTLGSSYDTGNPNGILGKDAISQRFISLENASPTGTNDLYTDGIPDWALESNKPG